MSELTRAQCSPFTVHFAMVGTAVWVRGGLTGEGEASASWIVGACSGGLMTLKLVETC